MKPARRFTLFIGLVMSLLGIAFVLMVMMAAAGIGRGL